MVKALVTANIYAALPYETVMEVRNQSPLWTLKSPSRIASDVAWFVKIIY